MTDVRSPDPGWYVDPDRPDQLRLWDGDGWTERTQAKPAQPTIADQPPAAAPPATRHGHRRGRIIGVVAILAAAVIAVVVAMSSGSSSPKASAKPTSHPVNVDCELPNRRPSPARLISYLQTHGVNIAAVTAKPAVPAGTCGAAGFTAAGSAAGHLVLTYPSYAAAAKTASVSSGRRLSASVYVVDVNSITAAQKQPYIAALQSFMKVSDPMIPLSSLMTTP